MHINKYRKVISILTDEINVIKSYMKHISESEFIFKITCVDVSLSKPL